MTATDKAIVNWLLDQMGALTADEKNLIISGDAKLRVLRKGMRGASIKVKAKQLGLAKDFDFIVAQLKNIDSREQAYGILNASCLNKSDLEKIIRLLDLPYNKSFPNERLLDMIVERTVGYRINSRVIQGKKD
jgi:hypothetical protein